MKEKKRLTRRHEDTKKTKGLARRREGHEGLMKEKSLTRRHEDAKKEDSGIRVGSMGEE